MRERLGPPPAGMHRPAAWGRWHERAQSSVAARRSVLTCAALRSSPRVNALSRSCASWVAVLKIDASTVANSMPKRSAVASWSAIAAALAASHPAEAASEAACVADAELTMLSGALNELMSSRSRACGRADGTV